MGLMNNNQCYRSPTTVIPQYLRLSNRSKLKTVKNHEERKPRNSSLLKFAKIFNNKINNE